MWRRDGRRFREGHHGDRRTPSSTGGGWVGVGEEKAKRKWRDWERRRLCLLACWGGGKERAPLLPRASKALIRIFRFVF